MTYNRHIPKDVCQKALDVWGKEAQILMVLEEMSELQKEILKNINRGKDNIKEIAEETADVFESFIRERGYAVLYHGEKSRHCNLSMEEIEKSDVHARLGLEKGKYILLSFSSCLIRKGIFSV